MEVNQRRGIQIVIEGAIGLLVKLSDNLTQDHYFLPDPDKFIFEFFPMEPVWKN